MGGVGELGRDRWPGWVGVPLCVLLVLGLVAGCSSGVTTVSPPAAPSEAAASTSNPLARGTDDTSGAALTTPASAIPTPSVNRVPTSSASSALDGWVELASFAGESLDVLTLGGPGLIAAGSSATSGTGATDALVRLSADGSTWRTAVVQESSGGSIHAIRLVGGAYVALGTRLLGEADFRGAVWTSTDAERWDLAATFPMLVPEAIVERDGQALAWGTRGWTEPSGLIVWTLDDVGRWGAARRVDAPGEAFLAQGVIATSRGYLVFGSRGGVIPAGADRVFIGISPDGLLWRFAEPQQSLDRAGFVSVVERPDGFLAMGWAAAADTGVPAVWRSRDGLAWSRVPDPTGLTDARLVRAALTEDRILVRGTFGDGRTSRAASWESSNGSDWTRLSPGSDIPNLAGAMSSDPVTYGGRHLVVATLQEPSTTRAVVLVQEALPR
jgi:hypothetical protein